MRPYNCLQAILVAAGFAIVLMQPLVLTLWAYVSQSLHHA